ncbi:MAG: dephospho-CoA kinase [Marinilabiliales bacterium]
MIKIGITGNIGSGKTVVSKVFKVLGVPVYNADIESKKILSNNQTLLLELVKVFGDKILDENKKVDKIKFAEIIFNDKNKLKLANKIIHPFVISDFKQWVIKHKYYNLAILESAILYESKNDKQVDKIIVVTAPLELKISRIMKRDNFDKDEINSRMQNQLNEEELVKRADYTIINDEKTPVIPQILKIYKELVKNEEIW